MTETTFPPTPQLGDEIRVSDFENIPTTYLDRDDPEATVHLTEHLEWILVTTSAIDSVSTTPTTDSREVALRAGLNENETPMWRDASSVPSLTPKKIVQAMKVIPSDYWQMACWTCRDGGHSTFTCPRLSVGQILYFAFKYYLYRVQANLRMASYW